ncbi:P-loop containing nucleoside triphosphate hydrolase protein [Leucogyrophana mollusca]|uniref:P-loop containing nucleoside triphosphate hydrolase protein n=1 Tax=Leucogyrophana mollusca TaxID=85980 RepID=A0ACB8BNA3_9AGAM|nr:P-loop containing nucleoside triphosphate hydrolase protein [Leucogyrophana mollusca]
MVSSLVYEILLGSTSTNIWHTSLIIPAYVAGISAIVLLLQFIRSNLRSRRPDAGVPHPGASKSFVSQHGGSVIYGYKFARFVGCLVFLGLVVASFELELHPQRASPMKWHQVALCATSAYAALLGLVSVTTPSRWGGHASIHLATLLLAIFAVFAYRDLFPLATFTKQPEDIHEGWLLWAKITVLTLISIVFPMISPRQYIPFDPANPVAEPHPEQTSSWLSMLTYTWENPTVYLAYRIPHLSYDHLPPLSDQDFSTNLAKKALPHLDPFSGSNRRHLFFGLMKVFRTEYLTLAVLVCFVAAANLASPLGIRYLLLYLETGGEGAIFRPWVWVVWLFLGPFLSTVAFEWYIFIATRALVQTESIIVQLVFNHSLRIRMKAELPDDGKKVDEPTDATALDSAQSSTLASDTEEGETETIRSSTVTSDSKKDEGPKSRASNLVGKLNNLVTTDLSSLNEGRNFLLIGLHIPVQVGLSIWFIYGILGWSAFVGLAAMIVLVPLPGYLGRMTHAVQLSKMDKADARVQLMTETLNVLRMVKFFGWEKRMDKKITEKREEELGWLYKAYILEVMTNILNFMVPLVTMLATYTTFTLIMGESLSASKVFSSMAVFDMMKEQFFTVFYMLPRIIQAKVSLDRINKFLTETELLDKFTETKDEGAQLFSPDGQESDLIGFRNAVFSWSNENDGSATISRRGFKLRVEDELLFQRGRINLIVGPTGSGKTSILMALLGEMHFIPSGPTSWFNLPRKGGIAYAAQESWVQSETIRDNILFGAPYDEARYKKVLHQCALERDLSLFEAGDQTEVGEKGLTLSGGQKARVTLARAIYSQAQILLLDDILAALDVHTAKWIVDKCLAGDLVADRTVLLVTHNVAMTSAISHFVVCVGANGRIASKGSISDAIAKDHRLAAEIAKEQEAIEHAEVTDGAQEIKTETKVDGKLVIKEEILEGHVSWHAFKLYLVSLGGRYPFAFWIVILGLLALTDLLNTAQNWFLGYWASQYQIRPPSEVNVLYYLAVYALLLSIALFTYFGGYAVYYYGAIRASRTIHSKLVKSILGTTLRWLDTTPTSRVITRCTQDIRAIDGPFCQTLGLVSELTLTMIIKVGAIVLITPPFLLPGVIVGVVGGFIGRVYMKAQLSVKREMSNAKAPVLAHFGAAMTGITSIRAYGAEEFFKQESLARVDRYTKSARMFYCLNRWVCVRVTAVGALFTAGLAGYLVYGGNASKASNIGFSLNMAVAFSAMIIWWVRVVNDLEVNGRVSLERIDSYIKIEQEPKSTEDGKPPAYWPASGDLRVENLSARYSSDGPRVLQDLSFHILSGERVGIVGRTGSGKSSLTLSLLRCIYTEGDVYFDGIPTSSVNLEDLRSNVTIIPQIPELLSGTLRQNLDPFDQHDDAVLNDALRSAGLFSLQDDADKDRLTLETAISGGGGNLSVGQRQILALARAMVRGSKLLILDEATSAIDYKTDAAIQSSLRHELQDVTQLIIAHRLHTIMDADKIMVLDAGKLMEFGSPSELLKNRKGMFRALVEESGDKDELYALAAGRARGAE